MSLCMKARLSFGSNTKPMLVLLVFTHVWHFAAMVFKFHAGHTKPTSINFHIAASVAHLTVDMLSFDQQPIIQPC